VLQSHRISIGPFMDISQPKLLEIADLMLMLAGGIVLGVALFRCRRAGRRTGKQTSHRTSSRDSLAGSPLRPNRLSLFWVWVTLIAFLFCSVIGTAIAEAIYHPASAPTDDDLKQWQLMVGNNIAQLLLIPTLLGIAAWTFTAGLRGFGIGRRSFTSDLTTASLGLLVSLCLCNLVMLATQIIFHWIHPQFKAPEHAVFTTLSGPRLPMFVRVNAILGAAILAPIGEELLFRGILQTVFRKLFAARWHRYYHRWAAIVCVAILFGLVHESTPQFIPALFVLGVVLGYLYERTGSILVPIYLHILFNSKSLIWHYLALWMQNSSGS